MIVTNMIPAVRHVTYFLSFHLLVFLFVSEFCITPCSPPFCKFYTVYLFPTGDKLSSSFFKVDINPLTNILGMVSL
jgi:hypothetical protein